MPELTREWARDRVIVRALTVAAFVVVLNETIMVNAIPRLMEVLDVSARAAQWLSTGFMLTMAVVIPVTGWFLQRVTTRAAFATAMGLFVSGTLLAAVAPGFEVLLAGRVIQAAGTAVMFPLLMTTVMTVVPVERRGATMGNVSLVMAVAPALGPALSGVVLQVASWRWLFGLVLPIAVLVGLIGLKVLTNVGETRPGRLDLFSVLLTALGFGALVYGLSQLGGEVEGPVHPVTALVVGVLGVAVFAWRQWRLQRGSTPLLDLRVLSHRVYLVGLGMLSLGFMALMGAGILLPIYLQQVRGLSVLEAGLMVMPGGLAMGLLGPRVGRWYDRLGARRLAVPGAVVVTLTMGAMTAATQVAPVWVFLALHLVLSVGLALVFTPVFSFALGSLPAGLYPHGSAMLGTIQQVAAAAGTALVITVMATRAAQLAQGAVPGPEAIGGGVQLALVVSTVLTLAVLGLSLLSPGRPGEPEDDLDRELDELVEHEELPAEVAGDGQLATKPC